MTVKELITALQQEDGNRLVVMSCDGEGNRYSPLSAYERMAYIADSTRSGKVGIDKLTSDLEMIGYRDKDVSDDGVPALIFYPTN